MPLPQRNVPQYSCGSCSTRSLRSPPAYSVESSTQVSRITAAHRHQEETIITAVNEDRGGTRPGLIVTAGTGAGKTESFLLPVLNDLYRNPRMPGDSGVRAIFLYPMNALVNDQVDRLNSWLEDQPETPDRITFMHFTSETPENPRELNRSTLAHLTPNPSRILTREQGRRTPPDILITNYSMLEYMLCRPQDASFSGPSLRSFVLDEVHLYSGTLAAEICLLMRRVALRCRVSTERILQIATSATLGGNTDELRQFGAALFSKESGVGLSDLRPPSPQGYA